MRTNQDVYNLLGLITEQEELDSIAINNDNVFPEADYDLQNEIIKFFLNNQAAEPEEFRQFAVSLGVDPDEMQRQQNILFTQLVNIYADDSSKLGYGEFWDQDEITANELSAAGIDPNDLEEEDY